MCPNSVFFSLHPRIAKPKHPFFLFLPVLPLLVDRRRSVPFYGLTGVAFEPEHARRPIAEASGAIEEAAKICGLATPPSSPELRCWTLVGPIRQFGFLLLGFGWEPRRFSVAAIVGVRLTALRTAACAEGAEFCRRSAPRIEQYQKASLLKYVRLAFMDSLV